MNVSYLIMTTERCEILDVESEESGPLFQNFLESGSTFDGNLFASLLQHQSDLFHGLNI
jgi:hypothetical protein